MDADTVEAVEAERDIKKLLQRHMEDIALLRMKCKDVLEPEHDDIFLLRYILSFKTVEKSEISVRKGIEYRRNNPWLKTAKTGEKWDVDVKVGKFTCAGQDHGSQSRRLTAFLFCSQLRAQQDARRTAAPFSTFAPASVSHSACRRCISVLRRTFRPSFCFGFVLLVHMRNRTLFVCAFTC